MISEDFWCWVFTYLFRFLLSDIFFLFFFTFMGCFFKILLLIFNGHLIPLSFGYLLFFFSFLFRKSASLFDNIVSAFRYLFEEIHAW